MTPQPPRALLVLGRLWIALMVLAVTATAAVACLSPAPTTLSTSLSGGGKEGPEITVSEGTGVKDTASLKGENAGKATGTVKYAVYSDSKCEKLVTKAGEVTVKEGKIPASEEKKLEAGSVYYWQAEYGGDSLDEASKSPCGKEVLTVKAKTSLSTTLSGGGKEGEEITVAEGSKVKDSATLSGTKASSATGTVHYAVYKDKECKELVSKAGEGKVEGGKAAGSEEKELEAGAVYYWQAEFLGDSLHEASKSPCGKEVLTVKAKVSLSTLLRGEDPGAEESIEGEEITVPEGSLVGDSATLSGTKSSTATGEVSFAVYADGECKELITEVGEEGGEEESPVLSEEIEAEAGISYWQASYKGDALHQASVSPCTEVVHVLFPTSLATSLSGEGEEGEVIEVSEDAVVTDTATLSGPKAEEATGSVEYFVYSDIECTELVTEAGESSVAGESVSASSGIMLEPGLYYWQAVYSGDGADYKSTSPCGSEVEMVLPEITTTLSGGGESDASISVPTGTSVHDEATLHGEHASEATGGVTYRVYKDEECKELFAKAGEVEVKGAGIPASSTVKLEAPGTYYWQAEYSGDEQNPAVTSTCGAEAAIVTAPTSLSTSLTAGKEEGAKITVEEGTPVSDKATLSGAKAETATGSVKYTVYADSGCTEAFATAGEGEVEKGVAEPSDALTLPHGTYYWRAEYWGDGVNEESIGECGAEVEAVTAPITTSLSGEGQSGPEIQVLEEASVTDQATLHGEHAGEASGNIEYLVYKDEECKELFAKAGKFEFEKGKVPASNSVKLEKEGIYYWRVSYSGDAKNPPATSPCGAETVQDRNANWRYASFGNSYSSGEGVRWTGGSYYSRTNTWARNGVREGNRCHRSEQAWPALIAANAFGPAAAQPPAVFERNNRFVFRACSGAVTTNIWSGPGALNAGKADEFEEPGARWEMPTPVELTWLPAGGDPLVTSVSVGIGGNDAGFAPIIQACWAFSRRRLPWITYSPNSCQAEVAHWEGPAGFGQIAGNLRPILLELAVRAPQARIRVFLYPHALNLGLAEIPVGPGLIIDNRVLGGGLRTAARSIERYTVGLNRVIRETVEGMGSPRIVAVAATEDALTRFGPHRLGDAQPWLNGFALHLDESFHPNTCGQKAVAAIAGPTLEPGVAAVVPCP